MNRKHVSPIPPQAFSAVMVLNVKQCVHVCAYRYVCSVSGCIDQHGDVLFNRGENIDTGVRQADVPYCW